MEAQPLKLGGCGQLARMQAAASRAQPLRACEPRVNPCAAAPGCARAQDVVERIRINNRPEIPLDKVMGFANRADAEDYMAANLDNVLGAVHFINRPGGKLDYMLQGSSTVSARGATAAISSRPRQHRWRRTRLRLHPSAA